MPVVRTYQRQVAPQAAPTVQKQGFRVPQLETPPGPVGPSPGAMERFGETVATIGEQLYAHEQDKQDKLRLLKADKDTGDLYRQLMLDPNSGALSVKGEGALALPDKISQAWDDGTAKIRQGLASDRQRQAFDEFNQNKKQAMMDRLLAHVDQQRDEYEAQAYNGKIANETELALSLDWANHKSDDSNLTTVSQVVASITQTALDHAMNPDGTRRIDKDTTDRAIAIAVSRVHEGTIALMQDQHQDLKAKAWYDEHKDQILGEKRGEIEKSLSTASALGEGQRLSDAIRQAMPEATETQMIDEIAKHTDNPEIRKAAQGELKSYWASYREDVRFGQEQASKRAQALLEQQAAQDKEDRKRLEAMELDIKNTMDRAPRNKTYEDVVPQSVRDKLPENVERAQREYWRLLTERKEPETDPGVYRKLMLKAANDPNGFVVENMMGYVNVLSRGDWKKLQDHQADIVSNNRKSADKTTHSVLSTDRIIETTLREIGIDPRDKAQQSFVDQLWRDLDAESAIFETNKGHEPDATEKQQIVDDMLLRRPVTVPGSWIPWVSARSGSAASVTPDEVGRTRDPKLIPLDERREIENQLRTHGVPVTDESVLTQYLYRHKK